MSLIPFIIIGVIFWVAVFESGIHASIAGAFLGFLAPLAPGNGRSVAERLERLAIPASTFVVVPLFAFSSVGIRLSTEHLGDTGASELLWGILLGLVVGKVTGITLASWVLIRLKLSKLPDDTGWLQLIGAGFVAGIGFTVSIFITELAFTDLQLINTAKASVLIASVISATVGYIFLRYRKKVKETVHDIVG